SIIPSSVQVVTIADREADFYDLFAYPRRQSSDYVIRATQNRCDGFGHLQHSGLAFVVADLFSSLFTRC
ncbi:hypothetical protein, partial [Cylindrospermopsis raciborskii]|uniref:hypothetical protein n=1 Tax=Cylindrospermopsis raciborskii TaxID=77022 RepID=UPI001C4E10E3